MLDLTPLGKAIAQLEKSVADAQAGTEDDIKRDGGIQRFKYTYETAHRMLRAQLSEHNQRVIEMNFIDLVQTGFEQGLLLNGPDQWVKYRTARPNALKGGNQQLAWKVFGIIPDFAKDAAYLHEKLLLKMTA
jgi:nucleotidyltransferase substrate binding protein (TIGR01987 family)